MQKLFILSVLSFLIFSCGPSDTENTMTITGQVKGLKKGTLYLQKIPDSTLVTLDSLVIEGDGNFVFKTEVESPEIFYLYLDKRDNNDINDRITFFGEPGTISIKTAWQTFDTKAKISGSKTNEKLDEYRKVMSRFNTTNLELMKIAVNTEMMLDSIQLDSLQKLSDKNVQRGYAFALNFALNNKDSHIAPYIALTEVPDANIKYLDSIYNSLNSEVADSKYGRALKNHLHTIGTSGNQNIPQ